MGWISVPQESPVSVLELERSLQGRVREKIASGSFKEGDVRYVQDVTFLPVRHRLNVSNEVLERLRRLCQLWEVDLVAPRKLSSHRKFIGPLIVAAKRCMFPILRVFFKDTLRRQRDFNAQVIATLAELASGSARDEAGNLDSSEIRKSK